MSAHFRSTAGNLKSANIVQVSIKPAVITQATFAKAVTHSNVLTIAAAATNVTTLHVIATPAARRLDAARRLVSETAVAWNVAVEVASTADAKSVGSALTDTQLLMDKASSVGVDIGATAPTVDPPTLKIETTYTVTQAASDSIVTMPSAAKLKQTAVDVMGAGAADPVVSVPLVTDTPALDADSTRSLSMPFGMLLAVLIARLQPG